MKHFYLALAFLTRIPVPAMAQVDAADFGRSALYYPLVGLMLGALLCIPLMLFPTASPILLAAVITVLWAMMTGGLHLDGVADGADAWLGGLGDEEKTHRILKDPLVGAAGVIAICSIVLLKFAALTVLIEHNRWEAIVFAPFLGRSTILLLFITTPYVRRSGLATAIIDYLPRRIALFVLSGCLLAGCIYAWQGILWLLVGVWLLRRLMIQRLQGCTGDTAGATVEVSEVLWMMGIALEK